MKPINLFCLAVVLAGSFSCAVAQPQSDEQKVREKVLLAAKKQGLDKVPEVIAMVRESQEIILIRAWERAVLAAQPVTQDLKNQVYKELKALLGDSEYKVFQVFLDDEGAAQSLIKTMNANPNWEELNIKTIVASSVKYSTNKPDWVNISSVLPEFRSVVKALKAGQVASQPIRVQAGWHVVGLIQTRPLTLPTPEKMDKELVSLAERKIVGQKLLELTEK